MAYNTLFLGVNLVEGVPFEWNYALLNSYGTSGFTTWTIYDLEVFPIVDSKFVIDLRLPIPYDVILLPSAEGLNLIDEQGRIISYDVDSNVTIDGILSPCCVTDNYIIVYDFNDFRIVKRSTFSQSVSVTASTVLTEIDLTPILTAITSAKTEILNFVPSIELAPVLDSRVSLNGNGCEFMDGKEVTVFGRKTIYSVVSSFMGLVADNSYTTLYDLTAVSGEKLTVPEALLTLYTAPIVIP